MGEVVVEVRLENTIDRGMARRGLIKEENVRSITTRAVVDSGAVMLVLPQDQVEELGLDELRKAIVTHADERKEERSVAGAVSVRFGKRELSSNASWVRLVAKRCWDRSRWKQWI